MTCKGNPPKQRRRNQNSTIVIIALLLVTVIRCSVGYDVLAIFPFSGKSHFQMFIAVSDALVARGHNVTVVSHFPKTASAGQRQQNDYNDRRTGSRIDYSLAGSVPIFENYSVNDVADGSGYLQQSLLILQDGLDNCEGVFSSGRLVELIRTRAKFDLVLVEIFNTGCFMSVANHFGAPVVGITSTSLYPWYSGIVGDVVMPSYVPVNLLPFTTRMTFVERVINTVIIVLMKAYYKYKYKPEAQQIVNKYLDGLNSTISEAEGNVNAVIVNTHFSYGEARPLPPGIIEVGGCTYKNPKPLPKDLDQYVTSAERGVIYFSMGSIVKGSSMPLNQTIAMLRAFGRLEGYKVLWKWEDDSPPQHDRPDNVMFVPWMPQFDVLNHSNVKLFISHGGLMGILDALYSGVPIIGIPLFADQFSNVNFIIQNKFGLQLQLDQIDEQIVYDTIITLLKNDEYTTNARRVSTLYRDRDQDPLEKAVFWIEYLAKYRVSLTPVVDHTWYEWCLIDVAVTTAAVLIVTAYLAWKVFSRAYWTFTVAIR